MNDFFCPPTWYGEPQHFTKFDYYPWVQRLPRQKKIFCAFWCNWHHVPDLPLGYATYIISFHIENINLDWLARQRQRVEGRLVVLFPGKSYGYQMQDTVFVPYLEWHRDLEKMISWHGTDVPHREVIYKYSAVCNRVTQSKIWITTKLLETAADQSLIILNDKIELKNVHNWQMTNNKILDDLTHTYLDKYRTLQLSDGFDQKDNVQRFNSNPWQPLYTESALHFTNASFHYSLMNHGDHDYIYPGPDIDEKTLKCLLAGTAFVACAQFEVYKTLCELGMQFDYDLDLSWDLDPGNLSRFEKILALIDDLNAMTIHDILDSTRRATQHNREFILKRGFFHRCEQHNKDALTRIFDNL